MNLSDMKLPRELEADGSAETIRQILMVRTVQLWSGSDLSVSLLTMSDPLKKVLRSANIKGRVRCGLEAISEKLEKEKRGIALLRERRSLPTGDRVSRLLLMSNDGAQRFYRHVEHLLQLHAPRLLGCMLDMDGKALGIAITGKESQIKAVIVEHKEAVSEILRALLEGRGHL
jgi:hypothetical protein